jgi:hypothetical protein
MLSDDRPADAALVLAVILVITAAIREGSLVDRYLDAVAWLIAGLTLSITVARAVFAPAKVTYHRVVGGVLLYLTIGVTFVALYGLLVLLVPNVRGLGFWQWTAGGAGDGGAAQCGPVTRTYFTRLAITIMHTFNRGHQRCYRS